MLHIHDPLRILWILRLNQGSVDSISVVIDSEECYFSFIYEKCTAIIFYLIPLETLSQQHIIKDDKSAHVMQAQTDVMWFIRPGSHNHRAGKWTEEKGVLQQVTAAARSGSWYYLCTSKGAHNIHFVDCLPKMLIQIGIGRIWRPGQNFHHFSRVFSGEWGWGGAHVGTGIGLTWWHCNINVHVKTQTFSAPFKR